MGFKGDFGERAALARGPGGGGMPPCPQSLGVLRHARALMETSSPGRCGQGQQGPPLTAAQPVLAHIRPGSAPPLRGQGKKFPICLAGVNGFSVIPGILLGGGSTHGTGPPSGTARHLRIRQFPALRRVVCVPAGSWALTGMRGLRGSVRKATRLLLCCWERRLTGLQSP